ncbi:hypothetical protein BDQ17DRAFT_1439717 [Cyathus striatus]|nr:hypothetical protein BDQ17DRAFT_1439717 [Cyathus striatus]
MGTLEADDVESRFKIRSGENGCTYCTYTTAHGGLYLQPQSLHTARRSVILTTALTWFHNDLPGFMVPIPLQLLWVLLEGLTPRVGLVGGRAAKIWKMVESYDQGVSFSSFTLLVFNLWI